jgi:hypothetical protein
MICKMFRIAAIGLYVVSCVACGDDAETTSEVLQNSGTLCLTQSGADITINTQMGVCLRGRCDYAAAPPQCHAAFENGQIIVTSSVEVLSDSTPGLTCPTDCTVPKAVCQLTLPPEGIDGEVPVVFGSREATVDLALASATPLFATATGDPCADADGE